MRFFALETDIEKTKAQFLNPTEQEVFTVRPHWMQFVARSGPVVVGLLLMGSLGIAAVAYGLLSFSTLLLLGIPIVLIGSLFIFAAYAEWRYDFTMFTIDKIVLVNSSLFQQRVYPMHYEHVVSATAETQFGNLLGFGRVQVQLKDIPDLKEESSEWAIELRRINIDFVANAPLIASRITDILTDFQRRKMKLGPTMLEEAHAAQQQVALEQKRMQETAKVRVETAGTHKKTSGEEQGERVEDEQHEENGLHRRRLLTSE